MPVPRNWLVRVGTRAGRSSGTLRFGFSIRRLDDRGVALALLLSWRIHYRGLLFLSRRIDSCGFLFTGPEKRGPS